MSDINLSRRAFATGVVTAAAASPALAASHKAKSPVAVCPPIPGSREIDQAIRSAHARYEGLTDGKNLDHPVLSLVPTRYFGIVAGTPEGVFLEVGDVEPTFSIQSISKVFTLALVLHERGADWLERTIGVNATGRVFNSIDAIEVSHGANQNPLVTPGAIAITGSVKGDNADEIWSKIIAMQSACAGRTLTIDEAVYKASSATNQRNRAIGMLMSAYGRFEGDPVQATDLYTRQCSIAVTARDLGVMAATLASGGFNPKTGRQVIDPQFIPGILAIMATAGLYDTSGQWLFHTGLPAKSGVGGGLIAVSPGKFGVASFSPPLDAAGNSVRGQKAIADISIALGGNPYAIQPRARGI